MNNEHMIDGIIIRQKNQETILFHTRSEVMQKRHLISEKAFLVAIDSLDNKAKFVRIEPIDYINRMEFNDMEVWHAIKEGRNYYPTRQIG